MVGDWDLVLPERNPNAFSFGSHMFGGPADATYEFWGPLGPHWGVSGRSLVNCLIFQNVFKYFDFWTHGKCRYGHLKILDFPQFY